jgi:murein endopeptidase
MRWADPTLVAAPLLLSALLLSVQAPAPAAAPSPIPTTVPVFTTPCVPSVDSDAPAVDWHVAKALGGQEHGRLVDGVQLPAEGITFITWDPGYQVLPSPSWRRWGTDRLLRTVLCVVGNYRTAHPYAVRVVIGDVSLEHGGPFTRDYGGPGHVSHQNGLDIDIYYPRTDRREMVPFSIGEVDLPAAQELVDRFVVAGASTVFVGPRTHLTGPKGIVRVARHHDNHLHVRLPLK